MLRAGHTGFTAGLCRPYFPWRNARKFIIGRAFARPVDYCVLQLSIVPCSPRSCPAHRQKARREAGLWVEALNQRQPITNAIS
jgi:hypothetical protein